VLGDLPDVLDQVPTPLLGEGGDRDPDQLAVVLGVEAEIRGLDGLLDRVQGRFVIGLHDQQRRLRGRQGRDLVQGGPGTVVVDQEPVDQGGGGPARARMREFFAKGAQRLVHLLLAALDHVGGHWRSPRTMVPIRSPHTALTMLPGSSMLNTMIGMLFSLHSVTAVRSITWRLRVITSR